MATPTLDEIEALARAHAATATLPGGYVQMDVVRLSDALLGLVAHVRALEKTTQLTDQAALDRITVMAERITALEAMVESHTIGLQNAHARGHANAAAIEALEAWQFPDRVSAVERSVENLEVSITALEAKVAALAGPVIPVDLSEIHAELDRLRAENAELRKVNANVHHVAAEYEERIAALEERDRLRTKTVEEQPQWPAPQPIETAPLGRILVVFEAGQMEVICPVKVDTESSWREFLKMNKATHWWPVPPPPGGGK